MSETSVNVLTILLHRRLPCWPQKSSPQRNAQSVPLPHPACVRFSSEHIQCLLNLRIPPSKTSSTSIILFAGLKFLSPSCLHQPGVSSDATRRRCPIARRKPTPKIAEPLWSYYRKSCRSVPAYSRQRGLFLVLVHLEHCPRRGELEIIDVLMQSRSAALAESVISVPAIIVKTNHLHSLRMISDRFRHPQGRRSEGTTPWIRGSVLPSRCFDRIGANSTGANSRSPAKRYVALDRTPSLVGSSASAINANLTCPIDCLA